LTLQIPIIFIKDKQAFSKHEGSLKIIGNPVFVAKDIAAKGTKLLHIVDEDAKKGLANNLDVYDKLTFFINIEMECGENEAIMKKLLNLKSRFVIRLPTKIDLLKLKKSERLLVGIIGSGYTGNAEGVHDVIIENADDGEVERFAKLGKRIIVYEKDFEKLKKENKLLIFGCLEPV
jgi:hypothetical protein